MFAGMPSTRELVMLAIALLTALTIHEYAHARAALAAGDDTAQRAGRISLNPLDHLDPMGTVFMIFMLLSGVGIGWGKPVPVNPMRFRSPRWDNLKVSLWGPLSNMLMAVGLAIGLKALLMVFPYMTLLRSGYYELLQICVIVNVTLALFNLIPVGPLDGSHIMASLLPVDLARRYEMAMHSYGMFILLALLVIRIEGKSALFYIISPIMKLISHVLLPA